MRKYAWPLAVCIVLLYTIIRCGLGQIPVETVTATGVVLVLLTLILAQTKQSPR